MPHKEDVFWRWMGWQVVFHDGGIILAKNWIIRGQWHYAERNRK